MSRFIMPRQGVNGQNLSPGDGAKLYFYEVGTTTPKDSWTDAAFTVASTNPVIADANGLFASIFISGNYDVKLDDKNDVQLWNAETIKELVAVSDVSTRIIPEDTTALMTANTAATYAVGDVVQTKEFAAGKGVDGGGVYDVVLTSGVTPNTFNIIVGVADATISFVLRVGVVNVKQWGALGDDTNDDTAAIQAAIDYALTTAGSKGDLYIPIGIYLIDAALTVTTTGNSPITIRGDGQNRSTLKAGTSLAGSSKPSMAGGTYAVVLSAAPIMAWNITTGCKITDIGFDGDDKDVYGLYINESFFASFVNMRITGCNKRPFTAVRNQVCSYIDCSFIQNGQGGAGFDGSVLFYDTSALTFTALNVERNGTARHSLEIFQPNNKGGWVITSPWFETGTVAEALNLPALGFMSVGGRNGFQVSPYHSYADNVTTADIIHLKASTETLVTDGITMTTNAANSWEIELNDTSATTLEVVCETGTINNKIRGFFAAAKVVNNATAANGNSFEPNQFAGGEGYQSVSGAFRVNKEGVAGGLPIGTADYIMQVTTDLIEMFGNANNNILSNAGVLEFHSNSIMRLLSGSSMTLQPLAGQDLNVIISAGGVLTFFGMPTASAGLTAGQVWSNGGVLTMV